jgi:hypothetical protein
VKHAALVGVFMVALAAGAQYGAVAQAQQGSAIPDAPTPQAATPDLGNLNAVEPKIPESLRPLPRLRSRKHPKFPPRVRARP